MEEVVDKNQEMLVRPPVYHVVNLRSCRPEAVSVNTFFRFSVKALGSRHLSPQTLRIGLRTVHAVCVC